VNTNKTCTRWRSGRGDPLPSSLRLHIPRTGSLPRVAPSRRPRGETLARRRRSLPLILPSSPPLEAPPVKDHDAGEGGSGDLGPWLPGAAIGGGTPLGACRCWCGRAVGDPGSDLLLPEWRRAWAVSTGALPGGGLGNLRRRPLQGEDGAVQDNGGVSRCC
jgi:hypothetical protein